MNGNSALVRRNEGWGGSDIGLTVFVFFSLFASVKKAGSLEKKGWSYWRAFKAGRVRPKELERSEGVYRASSTNPGR